MTGFAALFMVIWSTAFIVAKAIVPVANPNLFLSDSMLTASVPYRSDLSDTTLVDRFT